MSQRYSPVDVAVEVDDALLTFDDDAVTADNVDWICPVDDMLGDEGAGDIIAALCGIISSSYEAAVVIAVVW